MDLRTGCAFWVVKNGLLATYPSLAHDESADVAVLGAGITGAVTAYCLTQAGANVVVLDRRDVASGSTAASTALLQYETDASLEQLARSVGLEAGVRAHRLGLEAIDRIEAMCDATGDRCGFSRRPSLYLAASARDGRALVREHALRVAHGFDVALLSKEAVRGRFGFRTHGALYGHGDGELDSFRFTHKILAKAVESGARVYDRTNVTRLVSSASGLELQTEAGPRVRVRRLICAAGYEAADAGRSPLKGLPYLRSLTNLNSTWACATEPVTSFDGWEDRCLIWETARPYFYLRTSDDGRVVLGGEDSRFSTRHQDEKLLRRKSDALMKRFRLMFPRIAVEKAYSWAGVFAETADGLPFIGPLPGSDDVWYALGYGANGITFGVIAAELLRDRWVGRQNPDAAIFSFDRRQ